MRPSEILLIFASIVAFSCAHAETILGPAEIRLAANETVIVSAAGAGAPRYSYQRGTNIVEFVFHRKAFRESAGFAFAGPGILGIRTNAFISVQRLTNTPIQTIFLESEMQEITIPARSALKFFTPVGGGDPFSFSCDLKSNGQTASAVLYGGEEIDGPVSLFVRSRSDEGLVSFFITQDSLVAAPNILQSATGNSQLSVEQSKDLKSWSPAIIQQISPATPVFYRLSISR